MLNGQKTNMEDVAKGHEGCMSSMGEMQGPAQDIFSGDVISKWGGVAKKFVRFLLISSPRGCKNVLNI